MNKIYFKTYSLFFINTKQLKNIILKNIYIFVNIRSKIKKYEFLYNISMQCGRMMLFEKFTKYHIHKCYQPVIFNLQIKSTKESY